MGRQKFQIVKCQAFTVVSFRSSYFLDIRCRRRAVRYKRFGTIYRYHFKGSSCPCILLVLRDV